MYLPDGWNFVRTILLSWPLNVAIGCSSSDSVFHNEIVFPDPTNRFVVVGDQSNPLILPSSPLNSFRISSFLFNNLILPDHDPDNIWSVLFWLIVTYEIGLVDANCEPPSSNVFIRSLIPRLIVNCLVIDTDDSFN